MFPQLELARHYVARAGDVHIQCHTGACPIHTAWFFCEEAMQLELLPRLLDGFWRISRRPGRLVHPQHSHGLQNRTTYRRAGARGPITWARGECCLIAQPHFFSGHYWNCFPRGVSVWASDELSFHLPGSSMLLLAAEGLPDDDAEHYGFRVLVDGRLGLRPTLADCLITEPWHW